MTATLPRFGCNNLLDLNKPWLYASSEDVGYPAARLGNWRPGEPWRPTVAAWAAGDVFVTCYPVTAQKLGNWYFRDWTAGAASTPDLWAVAGAGATIARDGTNKKFGQYGAALTRVGTDCRLYQSAAAADLAAMLWLPASAGVWVKCSSANRARIAIYDGVGRTYSSYHSGGGAWEFLTVTRPQISGSATEATLEGWVDTGNATAYFDGADFVPGAVAPDPTPHAKAVDYFALHDHNLGTAAVKAVLQHSTDDSSWTDFATISPTDNKTQWVSAVSASKAYWRIKFTVQGTYAQVPVVSVAAFGACTQLPYYPDAPFDPYNAQMESEVAENAYGAPLGRIIRCNTREVLLQQLCLTRAEAMASLLDFWNHAGAFSGKPCFLAWNFGDFPAEALFCWLPNKAKRSVPMTFGWLVQQTALELQAVVE